MIMPGTFLGANFRSELRSDWGGLFIQPLRRWLNELVCAVLVCSLWAAVAHLAVRCRFVETLRGPNAKEWRWLDNRWRRIGQKSAENSWRLEGEG